ncbi:flagellar biosynthesis protein [Acinetobacter sp.]|uniref:flagellar biosynthesis protein n=1 Tax=Acinetobacter sp. TaxID=472 RepID=UPI003D04E42D
MNIISKIVLSSALIVGMTGCASTRGLVSLESPVQQINTQQSSLKTAVIKIVEDKRVFEDKPKQANIPSLKGGLQKATASDKAKAIARKRNGYGKAMGDIFLRDETVVSVFEKRIESALLHAGYKVVPAAQVPKPDLVLTVKVNKFWSWMQPGFSYITLNTEIETEISDANSVTPPIRTYTKISKPTVMATGSQWISTMNEALNDYESRLVDQLK